MAFLNVLFYNFILTHIWCCSLTIILLLSVEWFLIKNGSTTIQISHSKNKGLYLMCYVTLNYSGILYRLKCKWLIFFFIYLFINDLWPSNSQNDLCTLSSNCKHLFFSFFAKKKKMCFVNLPDSQMRFYWRHFVFQDIFV